MRLSMILALGLALVLNGRSLNAVEVSDADNIRSAEDAKKILDALGTQLGEAQAKLDEMEPRIDEINGQIKKNKYGGASNPEVSGNYSTLFKDVNAFGLGDLHGVAFMLKLDLSMLYKTEDGGSFAGGIGPAFTPGAYPLSNLDDTDEVRRGTGTTSRSGSLLGSLKFSYHKGGFSQIAGIQSFQTSIFTLSGPLSNRPVIFDKNPYLTNITSKAYFENQFLTGVPKRSAEESEHYLHGLRTDLALPADMALMAFLGNSEGFYDNDTVAHEYGGTLTWDRSDAIGSKIKVIAYNRSNDTGEVTVRGADPNNRFFGQINNTVVSMMVNQKLGPTAAELEVANSAYADPSGLNGGLQLNGQAVRLATETGIGESTLRLGAYSIGPTYLASDSVGKYNASGTNLPRYRENPDVKGSIIPQTVVADPTLPINNSSTYSIGSQLRFGNSFFNFNLQNSLQRAPSDARIWSAHSQGGGNLTDGTWFLIFNNNYAAWLPPSGGTTYYGTPGMEREFFYNPLRTGPAPGTTSMQLDSYNTTYAPNSKTAGSTGVIADQGNKLYYHAYHQLEANMWRRNFEGIVNADPATGRALSPSTKSISDASIEMRMNLNDYIPFGRPFYWQVYGELLTVNDTNLFVPSLDAANLFVQGLLDSTLVYNVKDDVVLLVNMGMENWTSDRMPFSFVNGFNQVQKGTLEYHDRQAGVGVDWNALPGKLNLYFRAKLLQHYDASAVQNSFQARQMSWEMKTYF